MSAASPGPVATPPEVAYASLNAPIGTLWMARGRRGILRISLRSRSERSFLSGLRQELGGGRIALRRDPAALEDLASQLRRYFARDLQAFTCRVDLSGVTPFQREVLEATARVAFGRMMSYGEIAAAIGRPGAARAVGNALGRNPVPIVIPCHRIVGGGGALGGFTGGTSLKRRLLAVEGIAL